MLSFVWNKITAPPTKSIANYKVPRFWKFVDAFPITVTGKIKKADMRAQSIKELGLEEVAKIKTS